MMAAWCATTTHSTLHLHPTATIMTGTVGVVAKFQQQQLPDAALFGGRWGGNLEPVVRWPGQSADRPAAMAIDSAGNVIVTGTSTSSSGFRREILTVKYGGDGMLPPVRE